MRRYERRDSLPGLAYRLLWFVGLWVAGVTVVGTVAYAIRWALMP